MLQVGIVGGTGFTGSELVRILSHHPELEIALLTSRKEVGKSVVALFPWLSVCGDYSYENPSLASIAERCDVVFLAAPAGIAMNYAPFLLDREVVVIDLSADFRISDLDLWEKWYQLKHSCPELLEQAVYGLSEINRSAIRSANLIANPGCHATAVQLALFPLLKASAIATDSLFADVKSGVSGAGRKADLKLSFCNLHDNIQAYASTGHRHLPEIIEHLTPFSDKRINLTFCPHLTPINRGIHATIYTKLLDHQIDPQAVIADRYVGEPFIDASNIFSHPDTASVRGTNICRISSARPDKNTLILMSVIDNLIKGAAGQAVQNLNIRFNFSESTALETLPMVP